MPFRATLNRSYPHLRDESDCIIVDTFNNVVQRCRGIAPHEPDYIAGLVLEGTRDLAAAWAPLLAPYQVSLTGVFCHQSPMVRFNNMGCELGDLLWVHEHTDAAGTTSRNALLLQAKKTSDLPHPVPAQDAIQFELYEQWPRFEYRHRPLAPDSRQVTPMLAHSGAQYLVISEDAGRQFWPPAVVCSVTDPLNAWHSLGGALAMFLAGGTGRSFVDRAAAQGTDDWDAVVWDLLRTSAHKVFNRRRARYVNEPRQVVAYLASLDGLLLSTGVPSRLLSAAMGDEYAGALGEVEPFDGLEPYEVNPPVPPEERMDDDDGGVSVLIFETREG